jgi:hypothetical protein
MPKSTKKTGEGLVIAAAGLFFMACDKLANGGKKGKK